MPETIDLGDHIGDKMGHARIERAGFVATHPAVVDAIGDDVGLQDGQRPRQSPDSSRDERFGKAVEPSKFGRGPGVAESAAAGVSGRPEVARRVQRLVDFLEHLRLVGQGEPIGLFVLQGGTRPMRRRESPAAFPAQR